MKGWLANLLLLGAALASGCVRLGYGATWLEQPLDQRVLSGLVRGEDDLTSCLARLGAPNYVWEYDGDGVAIGWYFMDATDWDFDISYAFDRNVPGASFSLDWDDNDFPGAVLWFDANLRLVEWRLGDMALLAAGLHRRPAAVEDSGPRK